ncbi:LOW QUALITY PROTEIN: NELL2-interacting cell ontogeny regulator 1 [Menidia menidia]
MSDRELVPPSSVRPTTMSATGAWLMLRPWPESCIFSMASSGFLQAAVLLMAVQLVRVGADTDPDAGTVIPAESRPCVDCHAFEFMQRALQDLKKTAFSLDARTETLVLRAERRALCDCMPALR